MLAGLLRLAWLVHLHVPMSTFLAVDGFSVPGAWIQGLPSPPLLPLLSTVAKGSFHEIPFFPQLLSRCPSVSTCRGPFFHLFPACLAGLMNISAPLAPIAGPRSAVEMPWSPVSEPASHSVNQPASTTGLFFPPANTYIFRAALLLSLLGGWLSDWLAV